jgi:hypothetical protein
MQTWIACEYVVGTTVSNGSAPITPGSAVSSSLSSRPFAVPPPAPAPPAGNYAAVLRATTVSASAAAAVSPSPLQPPPDRRPGAGSSEGTSPDENRNSSLVPYASILAQLDTVCHEVYNLLPPPWTDHVLSLVQKSLAKPGASRTSRDIKQDFLAAVNHCMVTKPPLARILDRASAPTKKQVMLVGGSTSAAHAPAPTIMSLKPLVCCLLLKRFDSLGLSMYLYSRIYSNHTRESSTHLAVLCTHESHQRQF